MAPPDLPKLFAEPDTPPARNPPARRGPTPRPRPAPRPARPAQRGQRPRCGRANGGQGAAQVQKPVAAIPRAPWPSGADASAPPCSARNRGPKRARTRRGAVAPVGHSGGAVGRGQHYRQFRQCGAGPSRFARRAARAPAPCAAGRERGRISSTCRSAFDRITLRGLSTAPPRSRHPAATSPPPARP